MTKAGGNWGPRVECKPKQPTGRTILGYKKSRFEAMAKAAGMSIEGLKGVMEEEREEKKFARRLNRSALRNLIKGVDRLYRDGTLKHGPTPVLNRTVDA